MKHGASPARSLLVALAVTYRVAFQLPAACSPGDTLICSFDGTNLFCECPEHRKSRKDDREHNEQPATNPPPTKSPPASRPPPDNDKPGLHLGVGGGLHIGGGVNVHVGGPR